MSIMKSVRQRNVLNWVKFSDGFLVLTEFAARGGVKYEQAGQRIGKGVTELTVRQVTDNRELLRESKSIVNAAYYVVDAHSAKVPFGFFTDEAGLLSIRQELADPKIAAEEFNRLAEKLQSERRVRVEVYPVPFRIEDPELKLRLVEVIRERLGELGEALRAGDKKRFLAAEAQALNMEKLLAGAHRQRVVDAVGWAKLRRQELGRLLRDGMQPREAGKVLDLSTIDEALSLFDEPAQN